MDNHSHPSKSSIAGANNQGKCPFMGGTIKGSAGHEPVNRDWWPNQLKLNILRQHSNLSSPMDDKFNYAEEFKSLNLEAVKKDIFDLICCEDR